MAFVRLRSKSATHGEQLRQNKTRPFSGQKLQAIRSLNLHQQISQNSLPPPLTSDVHPVDASLVMVQEIIVLTTASVTLLLRPDRDEQQFCANGMSKG